MEGDMSAETKKENGGSDALGVAKSSLSSSASVTELEIDLGKGKSE